MSFFQSRKLYKSAKDKDCGFCVGFPAEQLLKEYSSFNWVMAKSPYWSFKVPTKKGLKTIATHTMLIPKRHIKKLSDLNREESYEFTQLYGEISDIYDKLPTRLSTKVPTAQLLTMVRKYDNPRHITAEHLHIHFSPGAIELITPSLHPNAHKIEYTGTILDYNSND